MYDIGDVIQFSPSEGVMMTGIIIDLVDFGLIVLFGNGEIRQCHPVEVERIA